MTELWLVRHGESVANVAATAAERAGVELITVDQRDADVPLSAVGREQARAFGEWLAENGGARAPTSVWASSYFRAQQTVSIALAEAGIERPVRVDDRLRDRELGVLDLLTAHGVEVRYPEEAARRRWVGKFYYRPPGGESWADVALRLRSVLADIERDDEGGTVLIAAHDAVIMVMIYVCTRMTESEVMTLGREQTITNASVTRLVRSASTGPWELVDFAVEEHLEESDAPITEHQGEEDVEVR